MKTINIAKSITRCRQEKNLTQEQIATYIGFSKASVSKWETGQSYPDISLLPELASYFNISIDELIDYQAQLTKEEIRKIYLDLSTAFSQDPFDQVMVRCQDLIKKYYSCFPFLFFMGSLFINYSHLIQDPEQRKAHFEQAQSLFQRVYEEGDDPRFVEPSRQMEGLCLLMLGRPQETIDLLEPTAANALNFNATPLAQAYLQIGDRDKAKTTLQVDSYQNLLNLVQLLQHSFFLYTDDPAYLDKLSTRLLALVDLFDLKHLHPGLLFSIYLSLGQLALNQGKEDEALAYLASYTELACSPFSSFRLHGDDFFDHIEGWIIENLDLGDATPRDEQTIRRSLYQGLVENPLFASLENHKDYQAMCRRLSLQIKGS